MRTADYIFDYFYKEGIDTVFMLVGGGSMYLNDAVAQSKMKVICCHHEQACAMAAVGYSKFTNKPCVVLVTSGCGSTNTLTGLLDAYQDSVPVIFISGQVKTKDCIGDSKLRQKGIQEVDIIHIVKNLTSYAIRFEIGQDIPFLLSVGLSFCVGKRKSPVWFDIPLDRQQEEIEL